MSPASPQRSFGRHREVGRGSTLRMASRVVPAAALAVVLVASGGVPSVPDRDGDHAAALLAAGADRPGPLSGTARASLREGSVTAASRSQTRVAADSLTAHSDTVRLSASGVAGDAVSATSSAGVTAKDAADEAASTARFVRPVRGRVTSGYGPRWGRMHRGIDFGAAYGSGLYAVSAGTVTTTDYNSGLGHHVRLRLADGTEVSYGHMSRIAVERGQRVRAGARLGDVGNSGKSTGAHLHLEVRTPQGKRIDPRPWLERRDLL